MARRQQVIHINSNVKGKLPTGSTESVVDYGEIAVNYNETNPFLSILKNGKTGTSNADFAKFSADEVLEKLFDEKYATIEEIEKNEETISGALNELNEKVESIEDLVLDFTLLPQKNPVVGSNGNQTVSYSSDEVQLGITNGMTYAEFFQAILSGKDVIIKNTIEEVVEEHLRPFKCGHIKDLMGYNGVVFVYSYIYDLDDARDTEFFIMMSYDETGMVWVDSARILATPDSVRPLKIGDKEYKVFNEVTITAADLGLGKVLKYCGITTTELEDGSTATTVVIDGKNHTAEPGCVVFRDITENGNTVTQEFVYNGSKWELLGKDLTYKVIQDQIDSPTTDGSDIAFIDTISQNANGVITATKKNVRSATTGQTGVVQLTNSTTSTSTSLAATAKAVKTAFDKGAEALTAANGKWTAVDATTSVKGIVTLKEGDLSGVTATTSGVAASSYHTHSQYLTSHQDISHLATKQEVDDNEEVTSNALNVLNASISELEQTIEDNNALVLDLSLIGGIKSNLTSSELEIGFGGKRTYEEIFQEIANGKQVVLKYNNGFYTQILYPNTWFDGNGYVFIYNDIPSFTIFDVNNRVMVLTFTSDGCSTLNNELWVSRTGHTHDNYLTKTDGTVVKTTPQTLSNNAKNQVKENLGISTPDWNAQEGKAGYIKNKPFYSKGDIRQIDVDGEYTIVVGEFNIGDRIDISWDLTYFDEIFRGSTSFVIQEDGEEPTYYYQENDFCICGGKTFEMYAYSGGDSHYGKVTVVVNSEIKTLDDKYLPDTVVKTTPQVLSDDEKNQVKENLGISTPDWNAQEGESGYIENRTHYTKKVNGELFHVTDDIYDVHYKINQSDNELIDDVFYLRMFYTDGANISFNKVYKSSNFHIELNNGLELGTIETPLGYLYIFVNIDTDNIYTIVVASADGGYFNKEGVINEFIVEKIYALDEQYLPDTALKTTPQALSDDEKNQVKENLGISISTPDWNAQEGEAGYIENKPFEETYILKVTSAGTYTYIGNGNYTYRVNWVNRNTPGNVEELKTDGSIITVNVFGPAGQRPVTIQYTGYNGTLVITDQHNVLDEEHYIMFGVSITQIPEYFVPDTKNTAGATNTNDKIYLVGAKSQGAEEVTYSNSNVYVIDSTLTCGYKANIEALTVKNGLSVESGESFIIGGLLVGEGGLTVTDGATITGGLTIDGEQVPTTSLITELDEKIDNVKNELETSGTVHNAERIGGLTINEIVEQLGTGSGTGSSSGSGGNFSPTYKDSTSSVPLVAYELNKAVYGDVMMTKDQVWAPGGFFQKSDERLKNFVEDIEVDLDKIALLPKKYFYWKDDVNGGKQIGTSAQAVKELYPEMVSEGEDGLLNVDYDKLIVVALKAIDILNEERKQMKSDIQQIKDKLGL